MQIKLQARPASGLPVCWINHVAVAASGRIILNVWHPIVRSSSNKTQQEEEERVWGGIEWYSLCEFWLLHPDLFTRVRACTHTHVTHSWWTCSPAWQVRQHARAPRVSPGSFANIIAFSGPAGSSPTPLLRFVVCWCWENILEITQGDCLDGLAKLFPTDCLATEPVCIHDRFTLLSNPQEACVTT